MNTIPDSVFCLHCGERATLDTSGQYYHCTSLTCGSAFPVLEQPEPETEPEAPTQEDGEGC